MTRSMEPILRSSAPKTAVPSTLSLPIRLPCSLASSAMGSSISDVESNRRRLQSFRLLAARHQPQPRLQGVLQVGAELTHARIARACGAGGELVYRAGEGCAFFLAACHLRMRQPQHHPAKSDQQLVEREVYFRDLFHHRG